MKRGKMKNLLFSLMLSGLLLFVLPAEKAFAQTQCEEEEFPSLSLPQAGDDIEAAITNQWGSDAPPIKIFGRNAVVGQAVTATLSENEEKYALRGFEDPLPVHNECPGYGYFRDANMSIISRISLGCGRVLVLIRHAGGRDYKPGSEGYIQTRNGWSIVDVLTDQGPDNSYSGFGLNINKSAGRIEWQGRGGCPACACLENDTKIAVVVEKTHYPSLYTPFSSTRTTTANIEASVTNQWGNSAPPIKIFGQSAGLGQALTDVLNEDNEKYAFRAFEDPLPTYSACPGYGYIRDANMSIISRVTLGQGRVLILVRHNGARGGYPGSEGYAQLGNGWVIEKIISASIDTNASGYGVRIDEQNGTIEWQGRTGCPACACHEGAAFISVVVKKGTPAKLPEITVKQEGTVIENGGTFSFNAHELGSITDKTFSIGNTGTADLILNGSPIITVTGTNNNQFSVQQQPLTPVHPDDTTQFILRFAPTSEGYKTAAISITSNDTDKSPYVINLTGSATLAPLIVEITNPAANSKVSGKVEIQATATSGKGVKNVEFYIDGKLLGNDSSEPYSYEWNTEEVKNGSHEIKVKAYDTANQTSEQKITVTVDNISLPIKFTSLKSRYKGIPHFIAGVKFMVEFIAEVDWGNKTPSFVRFITPKNTYDIYTSNSKASRIINIAADFNACTSLKAIAISSDGTQSSEKIADMVITPIFFPGALVNAYQVGEGYYYNSTFALNIVDEKTRKVNSEIPLFGENEFGLKFIPQVDARVEINGDVSITLDWDNVFSKEIKVAGAELSLEPKLQINGSFNNSRCFYSWGGSAGLSSSLSIKKSWPFIFMAGPIPIPMYVKANIGVGLDGSVVIENINPIILNGELGPNFAARGTLGAGFDEIFNVEGWIQGGADMVLQWPSTPIVKSATISLSGGVSATAFLWKWENELLSWTWDVYKSDSSIMQGLSLLPPVKSLIPRDYLNSRGSFREMAYDPLPPNHLALSKGISTSPLQTSVFPYSYSHLSSHDTRMSLLWVLDDVSRSSINRTAAVYSSFDGISWSAPQTILDDSTADFHPRSLTFSDGTVIAVWEDEKRTLSESAQFDDMLKNMEISVSVFEPATKKWKSSKKLTSNNYFDFSPRISGSTKNNVMAVWLANESNEIRGSSTSPTKIYFSKYNGVNWSQLALAATLPMAVLKYDFMYNDDTGFLVFAADTDGNPSTIKDHELYLLTYKNNRWSSIKRLTNDNGVDGNPRVVLDSSGNIVLSWVKENGIYSTTNFDIANKVNILLEEYSSNIADFEMINSIQGRLAIVWAEPSDNYSDLYVSLYDRDKGTWEKPEQITADSETEMNITAAFYGNNSLISVYNRNNIEETQQSHTSSSGKTLTYIIPEIVSTDLYMAKLDLEEEVITPVTFQLNRTKLYFGVEVDGAVPVPQSVFISKSGTGTLYWSTSNSASWLNCTPSSGTNSDEIIVSVNPSGLQAGEYSGTLTISGSGATDSPQSMSVTLVVYGKGATSTPFGEFSTPTDGSTVSSSIPVTGWVLDDIGVENVKIYREENGNLVYIGDSVFVEGARPDVELAYPGYPMNYQAGWGYMLLTNFLPNGGNGTFKIHAIGTDTEGHQVTLGTKTITCDNAHAVKPFGAIDSPQQGGEAYGTSFRNQGWVLTPRPNHVPKDGSTVKVWINGLYLGNATYNIYREDIARLFPGYVNSYGALGYFDFDTTAYSNGIHTICWTVEDNAGNSDGIGSRYFKILNVGALSSREEKFAGGTGDTVAVDDYPQSVFITTGYKENSSPIPIFADENNNVIQIHIPELERVEVHLGSALAEGYMQVGEELRPLPVGSTLDKANGIFYWWPGPGFIGKYDFVFMTKNSSGEKTKKRIQIVINPLNLKVKD